MAKFSNVMLVILNAITLVISAAIIVGGIWLATQEHNDCASLARWPVIGIGVFFLIVSLIGLIGSCDNNKCLLFFYLFIIFLLILLLITVTVFGVIVTIKGADDAVSDKGIKEYRLGDYSTWLKRHVVEKPAYWDKIKSCLIRAKVCNNLQNKDKGISVSALYRENISPIQSGCCKPPTACNFTYVNATTWINATTPNADVDCKSWNSTEDILCYDCQSCKAGVLQTSKDSWKKMAIINACVVVFLILVILLGCCAARNSSRRYYHAIQPGFYVKQ
ncbi:hypothetical protein KP509_01G090700 [Ceratopteris richardii]|uniref:Tetraspanin-8 n=1 Tax=Ceratopteris richardii TaxID=49495 RepID=A0A8T2VJ38_CERRI|nr:hypothetical protein KP509_01G090700 [Ceratopteris richardii]